MDHPKYVAFHYILHLENDNQIHRRDYLKSEQRLFLLVLDENFVQILLFHLNAIYEMNKNIQHKI